MEFPPLDPSFEPTRATLHAAARVIGAVTRRHGTPHPRWWHLGLEPTGHGLAARPVPLPGGGSLDLSLDLERHELVAAAGGDDWRLGLDRGFTATGLAGMLMAVFVEHDLEPDLDPSRYRDDDHRAYDRTAAAAYRDAIRASAAVFATHRATLGDPVGPIQVWPHGFDLAFEWFGTREVSDDEGTHQAQLNLGFYPGGDPYFYSNPWPFDEAVLGAPLPHGARWHTEGWQGTLLPYRAVQQADDPASVLLEYARAVFDLARPTLDR